MQYFTKFKPFAAPKSYTFVDPDTQHKYKADTKERLFYSILSYREQNDLPPIQALDLVLENYWCSLPENCGSCERVKLKRGWMQYVKGSVALLENLYYGASNLLTPQQAEKRAIVCTTCPHNVFPDKSAFLSWSDNIALHSTGGLRCSSYDLLGNCEVCTCPLRALVFYKEAKVDPKEVTKYPSFCWKITEYNTNKESPK